LVVVGFVLGLLMLLGGVGLGAYAAPYFRVDWGAVLIYVGAIIGSAGAVTMILSAVLRQLKGIRTDIAALATARLAAGEAGGDATQPWPAKTAPDQKDIRRTAKRRPA
jgi:hypothetical protein